jgi:hypothetical protein
LNTLNSLPRQCSPFRWLTYWLSSCIYQYACLHCHHIPKSGFFLMT